jgi:RHS repeat-associated protein
MGDCFGLWPRNDVIARRPPRADEAIHRVPRLKPVADEQVGEPAATYPAARSAHRLHKRGTMRRTRWVPIIFLILTGCGIGEITVGNPKHGTANTQAVGTPDAGIVIDTTTNQFGRLTRMGNGLYRFINQYDDLGRATAVQHVMENVSYVYEATFGYANRAPVPPEPGNLVATMTFPDGETVAYGYDSAGGQSSITATPAGAAPSSSPNIVSQILRNERGQTTEVDYGNGAVQYHCYNDGKTCGGVQQLNTDLRLSEISTALNGILQQYTYLFDPNGNVTSVADVNGDATSTYCYDSLDRLTSGGPNCLSGQTLWNFGYDDFGNLTSKDGISQTYIWGTHRLGCVGGSCPASGLTQNYDANGNMISRSDGLAITWTAENMPAFVSGGAAATSTEKYFLGEALWKKVQGGVVTYFLPSMRVEDGLARKYFGTFAERSTDGTLKFYQSDHLGSATLVTDANGNVIRRASYQPFGEDRAVPIAQFSPATGLRHEFNFKEQEQDGSGFYDYGARVYDPATGRWLSADSVTSDGLNRYAYVRNNPLKYTDPSGRETQQTQSVFTDDYGNVIAVIPNNNGGKRESNETNRVLEKGKKAAELTDKGVGKVAAVFKRLAKATVKNVLSDLDTIGPGTRAAAEEQAKSFLHGAKIAEGVAAVANATGIVIDTIKVGTAETKQELHTASAELAHDAASAAAPVIAGAVGVAAAPAAVIGLAVDRASTAVTIVTCSDCVVSVPPEAKVGQKIVEGYRNMNRDQAERVKRGEYDQD